ncbi:MAG: hypothetical protein JNJ54_01655 [Myxococcaceae bacterium]|nr:hypothetical protein [Myxococcaceae bacterium]
MKVLVAAAVALSASLASAACYRFDKAPNDVYVCVKGDSFDNRKQAKAICDKATGKDCGNVASYSSSCHSNIDKCYDENGKAHRSLSGY